MFTQSSLPVVKFSCKFLSEKLRENGTVFATIFKERQVKGVEFFQRKSEEEAGFEYCWISLVTMEVLNFGILPAGLDIYCEGL